MVITVRSRGCIVARTLWSCRIDSTYLPMQRLSACTLKWLLNPTSSTWHHDRGKWGMFYVHNPLLIYSSFFVFVFSIARGKGAVSVGRCEGVEDSNVCVSSLISLPHKPFAATSNRVLSCKLAEAPDNFSPINGCRWSSIVTLLQTWDERDAVQSLILLCLCEGIPPIGHDCVCSTEDWWPQSRSSGSLLIATCSVGSMRPKRPLYAGRNQKIGLLVSYHSKNSAECVILLACEILMPPKLFSWIVQMAWAIFAVGSMNIV